MNTQIGKSNTEIIEDTSSNKIEIKESDKLEEKRNLTTDVPVSLKEVEEVDIKWPRLACECK